MKNRVGLLLFAFLTVPLLAQADILRPQTLAAWDEYIGTANVRTGLVRFCPAWKVFGINTARK